MQGFVICIPDGKIGDTKLYDIISPWTIFPRQRKSIEQRDVDISGDEKDITSAQSRAMTRYNIMVRLPVIFISKRVRGT